MYRRTFCLWPAAALAAASVVDAHAMGAVYDISESIEPIRDKYKLPALAAGVVVRGQLRAIGATGLRKEGDPTRVSLEDKFHLGSCTKAMTGTLIAMLIEQGKLGWDSTIRKVLPDLAARIHPSFRDVPLTLFLWHRSGLKFKWPDGNMSTLPGTIIQQRLRFVELLLKDPPEAEPGTKYIYSHGFTIAAAMAERVTGKSWEVLIVERLFAPLGMSSVGFGAMGTPGKIDQPWQHAQRQGIRTPIEPGPNSDNPAVGGPSGAVHCSIRDWCRFAILHAVGDARILNRKSMETLHTAPAGGDYAMGWIVADREWAGGKALNHGGSNTMNQCVIWVAPVRQFAVVVASNDGSQLAGDVCSEVAGTLIGAYIG